MFTLGLLALAGCIETHWSALPYPIPMALSGPGGALLGQLAVSDVAGAVPVVVDTGTILTAYDDGSGQTRARRGNFVLFGVDAAGNGVPRLSVRNVQLFEGPLGAVGVGAAAADVGAVLGGDNLSRFAVGLDYRGAQPTMTLTSNVTPCSCELAPACDRLDSCYAVLPFSLAGGQDTSLQSQTRIVLGDNQYTYPPTRVLLDACIEPFPDPLRSDTPCVPPDRNPDICPAPPYLPSGVDMKLVVATGFPGLALSANAYDRLRGTGAAEELLAGTTTTLHLGDPADEGPSGAGVQAAMTTLGRAPATNDPGASALALVSNEFYFGPCASLARSRRVRRYMNHSTTEGQCELAADRKCMIDGQLQPVPVTAACLAAHSDGRCSDTNENTPVAAVVELTAPIDVYVLPDVTPLLVGLNADVRTTAATVDGVVGTAVLSRLVATVDYPGNRVIARCASDADCVAYPRMSLPSHFDCGFCAGPLTLQGCATDPKPGSQACPAAP